MLHCCKRLQGEFILRTILTLSLFIVTGICTALFFGFDLSEASAPVEYDDEQEGMKGEVVLTFSHVAAEHTPKGMAARRFASLVEKRTHGQVDVEVYSNGTLYNDQNEYQALKEGHIQMIAPTTAKLTTHFPRWQILDLPFAFPTHASVTAAYEGIIGQSLRSDFNKVSQVKAMTFWYNGYKQMTSSDQALIQPSDFRLSHFRVMPSPAIHAQFEELGASTSILPFNKTYHNLEVDFIDGQENTISNIYTKKFYQEQSHLTISNHGYLGYAVLINEPFWNQLSSEHRTIIKQALHETTNWTKRHSIEMNDQYLRSLKRKESLNIHYLTQAEREQWKQTLQPVYEEKEPIIGGRLMNELERIQDEYRY